MRYLLTSFLVSLLLGVGFTLPAAAADAGRSTWSDGSRLGNPAHRTRLVRASYGEHAYDEDARPRRRYHRHDGGHRPRYTKRRHTRTARHVRHHQRTARRHGATRHKTVHRRQEPAQRQAAVAPAPAPAAPSATPGVGKKSLGADGHKPAGMHGVASYYWEPQALASGGRFNPNAMTAAHKTLPFGTRVRVTHLGNGRSVEVKINDRGPYVAGRIIDLSKAAAAAIGMTGQGIARVAVEVLGK
jgi:rare lipoprotein A